MTVNRRRRRLLKLGGLAVSTGTVTALAGCSNSPLGGDGGGDAQPLSVVPAAADNVAYVDVAGVLEDAGVETVIDTALDLAAEQPSYDGPSSFQDALDQAQDESDLDPTAVETSVGFSRYGQQEAVETQYGGAWIEASWSEQEVLDAMEAQGSSFSEDSYEDYTVYVPEGEFQTTWVAVLAEGEYVTGPEEAVKDVLDVDRGENDGVDQELRDAYEGARSGLAKVVGTVPEDISESAGGAPDSVDVSQFDHVEVSTAVVYHEGSDLGVEMTLQTGNADDAEDVENVIAGGLSTLEGYLAEPSPDLEAAVDEIEVSREESTVTVRYANAVEDLTALLEAVVEDFEEMEGGTGTQAALSAPGARALSLAAAPVLE